MDKLIIGSKVRVKNKRSLSDQFITGTIVCITPGKYSLILIDNFDPGLGGRIDDFHLTVYRVEPKHLGKLSQFFSNDDLELIDESKDFKSEKNEVPEWKKWRDFIYKNKIEEEEKSLSSLDDKPFKWL